MDDCLAAGDALPRGRPEATLRTERRRGPGAFVSDLVLRDDLTTAIVIAGLAASAYLISSSREPQNQNYFVRLADAFLHGRIYLTEAPSWLNELIPKDGVWYVAYPPMPAVILMPFVALFGSDFPQQIASCLLGGVSVGLAWLVLGEFRLTLRGRFALTLVFGFGTVLWYVAEVGSVWYFSHVVAVTFSMAAILLALKRQSPYSIGLLLGLAAISRLPVALTAPFFLAMVLHLEWPIRLPADAVAALRRVAYFGLGLAIPIGLYALYNLARWGTPIDQGYVLIPGVLADPIYSKGGIFSLQYIPRQLYAIFLRSWNYVDDPPFLQPSWWGLSLFLTTPLFLWLGKVRLRDPRVLWAIVGTAIALIPILTHGNVGISQFGYRFSLDVQPLLLVMLATVFERGMSRLAAAAAVVSVAVCGYAIWAISIGFVAY